MKPKLWTIISGCGCAFLTLVGGSAVLTLGGYLLYESGVRDAQPEVVIPFALLISGFLGILLGCLTAFLIYRWRKQKPSMTAPVANTPAYSQPAPHAQQFSPNAMAVASLGLGIISILPFCGWCGLPFCILGIVFAKEAQKQLLLNPTQSGHGFARWGLYCSWFSLIAGGVLWLVIAILASLEALSRD